MDLEKIKNLMKAMEDRKISRLSLKEKGGVELTLEREGACRRDRERVVEKQATRIETPASKVEEKVIETKKEAGHYITSPMVGTMYTSPSPEDSVFVKVGDTVDEDTVVCIIEAMKVMNEVKAGKKGKIVEVLVENSQPVEFGTKLFGIE